jgi:predicted site-specific integrase-resolvase
MKLSDWAKKQGISYRTAWNMFKNSLLPTAYKLPSGTIIIPDEIDIKKEYNVVYARVSNSKNKPNLESQAERITQFCLAKGWIVNEIVKECASGLNDSRPKLQKILKDKKVSRIVVEHKDRLTRFGFEYIKTLFDGEIVILNESKDDKEDLISDFTSIITSFCARIYGQRRSQRKTEQLIKELENDSVN